MRVGQRIDLAFHLDCALSQVQVVQQQTVVHAKLRSAANNLTLQLKLQYRHRLVHLRHQVLRLLVHAIVGKLGLRKEECARVVAIDLHGEGGQRQEVDAIAILQGGHVAEAQTHADYVGHTGSVARRRSHPKQVVVAPLNVEVVVITQDIHDQVCPGTSVVDVAYHVQQVDRQPLDQVGQSDDEIVGPTCGDDGSDDLIDIGRFVGFDGRLVQQLLDDVGKLLRKRLAHLRAGVFRGDIAAHAHQLVQRHPVPIVEVALFLSNKLQFLLRVVDQRTKILLLLIT